ncbi:MAG TPA: CpsB/CapC family capsule biosynthesis tyrosine phosphatase [Gaiellaceae bacterium]|jgi:protein-tyrosine phosphatase|nr:CpsB/CapC family capsule biosynthesis tyrosine phosphatase [Gaiellaceae bacterium]
MIDLHAHVLPGLDDGATTLSEAVELVRLAAADGVRVVAATPHVRDDWPTCAEAMEAALAEVREAVARAGITVDVRGGGEIALPMLGELSREERARFGLGGNPALLLLEYPYVGIPLDLARTCAALRREGIVPVIAHPERNPDVQERPAVLEDVVRLGGLVQLTAASVSGALGRAAAECSRALLALGLAHLVSTDAHGPYGPSAGLPTVEAALGDAGLARWLVDHVPAALLAGEDVPLRPAARGRWRLLGR